MNYQFDNLIPYLASQKRLKADDYWVRSAHTQEADQLLVFTTKKHAYLEAEQNEKILRERCAEQGFAYYIQGHQGIQLIYTNLDKDGKNYRDTIEKKGDAVLGKDYIDTFNKVHSANEARWYSSLKDSWVEVNQRLNAFYLVSSWYAHLHTVPEKLGMYSVATGKRIKGRKEILKTFWDLGFLASRRRILYAASPSSGTPEEVLYLENMKKTMTHLHPYGLVRSAYSTAQKKMIKDCDYPLEDQR